MAYIPTGITSIVNTVPSSVLTGVSIFGQLPSGTAPLGSIAALQGTNPWVITGSVQTIAENSSVQVLNFPTIQDISGSVVGFQGTNPWIITGSVQTAAQANQSVSGTVGSSVIGTVPITQSGTNITSLVNIIPSSVIVGASIFGLAPVNVTNSNLNVAGSVVAFQGSGWSGSVVAVQTGTRITSLVSTIPSSVIVGASIFGLAPVNVTNTNLNVGGSVVAFQGTNPWVVQSIVGTYAEDAAHSSGDKGMFALGVRNDTLASITSADLDYSPRAVGPAGETIAVIAPFTKGIQGTGDLRGSQGASVTVIAAQGASIYSYIRGAQLANLGSASVLVTFAGGLGSLLSYSIAPAGGGSNIRFDPWLKTGANSAFTASISGVASVLVSAQGFIAKE